MIENLPAIIFIGLSLAIIGYNIFIKDKSSVSNDATDMFGNSKVTEQRRSKWSSTFTIIGWILLVGGLLCVFSFLFSESDETASSLLTGAIAGIAGGLHALLFGFLINVFTDIRWYLAKIANKDS